MKKYKLSGIIKKRFSTSYGYKLAEYPYSEKGKLKDGKIFYPNPFNEAVFFPITDCKSCFDKETQTILYAEKIECLEKPKKKKEKKENK